MKLIGLSFDRPEDNRAFATKHGFPFRLLSDVDRTVGERYETPLLPELVLDITAVWRRLDRKLRRAGL